MPYFVPNTCEEADEIYRNNKKMVIKYTASWCGPCKRITPFYMKMAEKYPNIPFIDVDVEKCPEFCNNVGSLPTFDFVYNLEISSTFSGASEDSFSFTYK